MKVSILGCDFDSLTLQQSVDAIFKLIGDGERGWISTVNVSILMMMRSDTRLKQFVDRSALIVADGQPLVWSAALLGGKLPERVTGIDLIDLVCARAASEDIGVFFLGATESVCQLAALQTQKNHPNLQLNSSSGYFRSHETTERVAAIRNSGAKILFVAMGVPRQERFIEENWDELGVAVAIGVGGSFDVIAGLRRRAPIWAQKAGLEWCFRLAQEPRRLAKRYLVTNSTFLFLLTRAIIRKRS